MHLKTCISVLVTMATSFGLAQPPRVAISPLDQDGDGLTDRFENDLLVRFAPSFRTAADDCAVAPVAFVPGSIAPRPTDSYGTIYGQAFPVSLAGRDGAFIELHYYHLWKRDCGRKGHRLDVEHVSALLRSDGPGDAPERWAALYWYAAAHERTSCEGGNGAVAARIHADKSGPEVWVSRGKHASYLSPELCRGGCGADSCETAEPLTRKALINIGERGAVMNGAQWTQSPAWPFDSKLDSDFTPDVIAAIEACPNTASTLRPRKWTQSLIGAGSATADGIATGKRETGEALETADNHTDRALGTASNSVKTSLKRALLAVRNALFPAGKDAAR